MCGHEEGKNHVQLELVCVCRVVLHCLVQFPRRLACSSPYMKLSKSWFKMCCRWVPFKCSDFRLIETNYLLDIRDVGLPVRRYHNMGLSVFIVNLSKLPVIRLFRTPPIDAWASHWNNYFIFMPLTLTVTPSSHHPLKIKSITSSIKQS